MNARAPALRTPPTTGAPRPHALVTGGTGFIGTRLVRHLIARVGADRVTCFIRPPASDRECETVRGWRRCGVHVLQGDLLASPICDAPAPEVDVVFHLAANVDTAATDAESRVNDLGTLRLLEWLGARLRGARLLFSSSVAVADRDRPAAGPLDETSPCTPRTSYGRTKLRAEHVIRERSARDGYTFTILRLLTVYGPGQKAGGMFDLLMKYAAEGSWLARIDWPGRTSIIYLDDAVRLMVDLSGMPAAADGLYCVASAESLTVGQIARRLGEITGHPIRPVTLPIPLWRLARRLAFNRLAARCMPRSARVAYWRLGLIADDGFWQSAAKLQATYDAPLTPLDEGVRAMLAETRSPLP